MIAVIFEVTPAEGQALAYLDRAARLNPFLEKMDEHSSRSSASRT